MSSEKAQLKVWDDNPQNAKASTAVQCRYKLIALSILLLGIVVAAVLLFTDPDVLDYLGLGDETDAPTGFPTSPPPTQFPTSFPTSFPVIPIPTASPTFHPTVAPIAPTPEPTTAPTAFPTTPAPISLFPQETRQNNNYIGILFLRNVGTTATAAFLSAAARWSAIVGDTQAKLPANLVLGAGTDACGTGDEFPTDTFIDHLMILADTPAIDGVNGILGQAGPCLVSLNPVFPVVGIMQFDSFDVSEMIADGILEAVILHEMGHVLGIGTLWPLARQGSISLDPIPTSLVLLRDRVIQPDGSTINSNQPKFIGSAAKAEYSIASGASKSFVPVEDGTLDGRELFSSRANGAGSIDSHWDQDFLPGELMVFSINPADANHPLSSITIASLKDLGYTVDVSLADAYDIDSFLVSSKNLRGSGTKQYRMVNDTFAGPIYGLKPQIPALG